jgi:hypothetical protein
MVQAMLRRDAGAGSSWESGCCRRVDLISAADVAERTCSLSRFTPCMPLA